MNIFTANQVNQVYVLKANSTVDLEGSNGVASNLESAPVGSVVMGNVEGDKVWFLHKGAGGITRSDIIEMSNLLWAEGNSAEQMRRYNRVVAVRVNSEASDGANVIPGDYTITIKFQNPIGMSPDNQYWKFGAVRATDGMTKANFMQALKDSIDRGLKRDDVQLIKTKVNNDVLWLYGVTQEWVRGVKQVKPVIFSVECSTIDKDRVDVIWGDNTVFYSPTSYLTTYGGSNPSTATTASVATLLLESNIVRDTTINNGFDMADYEYFYMGERADQYRFKGWPNYVPTEYLVDPSLEYNTYAIHFAYTGSNHAVQKSEKEITFLVPVDNTDANSAFAELIAKFRTTAGDIFIEIDSLDNRVSALETE